MVVNLWWSLIGQFAKTLNLFCVDMFGFMESILSVLFILVTGSECDSEVDLLVAMIRFFSSLILFVLGAVAQTNLMGFFLEEVACFEMT